MEVWAWGTNVEHLNDCVKRPVLLTMISGGAADPIRAVACFGEKMMVSLSEKGQLQGAGSSAYAHFAPGGTFDPSYKDKFRQWSPFGFDEREHAFANTEV